MALNVLVIDDDSGITTLLETICIRYEHPVDVINNPREVLSFLKNSYDLIFLDLNMPGMDGIEVMRVLSSKKVTSSLVLMSGFDSSVLNTAHELAEAHHLNVLSHMTKPFKVKQIKEIFERAESVSSIGQLISDAENEVNQINEAELREALQNKQIEVFYQPQMDLKSRRIVGVEALCRLRAKDGTLIYPDDFIPLAEKLDLIHDLTLQVARIVSKDYENLFSQYHGMTVSINVSTQDLEFLTFPEELQRILSEGGVEPGRVIVEVTETLLIHELSRGLDVLARMRLKGFKVSIDDFGKGAAALEHVKHFPATEVKIDKEFVQSIGSKDKSHVIVTHTLDLAHKLSLDVVAEGIEDQETADWLTQKGCDIGQGYWLSRPIPLDELRTLLIEKEQVIEVDSTFSLDDSPEELETPPPSQHSTDNSELLVSSILPLKGSFSFIGNSQLYGIKTALNEYHLAKRQGAQKIKLEVFDDESDINLYMKLAKNKISPRSLACLGGVFTLGNTKWFINAALSMKRAVIGPFSGSILLRNSEWKNLFNVRPSYEDEIKRIIEEIGAKDGKAVLVYPENAFGCRAQTIVDKLLDIEHMGYSADNRTNNYLAPNLKGIEAKHILFIGASKTMIDLVHEMEGLDVIFYTISLIGLGSLIKSLERCNSTVTVTAPIDDYQGNTLAATQFRKHLNPLLNDDAKKYMNSISFEAYLNTKILIKGLEKSHSYTQQELIQCLEGLEGADVGLDTPVTWVKETRQLLHKVYLLKGKICSKC